MKVINVSSIVNVCYISPNNDPIWSALAEIAKNEEEDVEFDMQGIELIEPWKSLEFPRFIELPNVYIKLYYAEDIKDSIIQICKLRDCNIDKVTNVSAKIIEDKPKNCASETVKLIANKLVSESITRDGTTAIINYEWALSYIEKTETILGVAKAVGDLLDAGAEHVILDLKGVTIQAERVEFMFNTFKEFMITGKLKVINMDQQERLDLLAKVDDGSTAFEMSVKDKLDILNKEMKPGTVGLLTMYYKSRSKSKRNSINTGDAAWTKVAMFKGIENDIALFDIFVGKYFHTKAYKISEEIVDKGIVRQSIKVPVDKMGFWGVFLGSEYHFNFPVQFEVSDSIEEVVQVDGDTKLRGFILPEFIQMVLDEYNEEYNKEALEEAITATQQILSEKLNQGEPF